MPGVLVKEQFNKRADVLSVPRLDVSASNEIVRLHFLKREIVQCDRRRRRGRWWRLYGRWGHSNHRRGYWMFERLSYPGIQSLLNAW